MWHEIKHGDQKVFFKCNFEDNCIKYFLYNLKEIWSENCSIDEITQRAKNLNPLINYQSDIVIETLKFGTPTTVSIDSAKHNQSVVLKYYIQERPFKFCWNLKPLNIDEFQKTIINPLFLSIHFLAEQIEELKKTIKKKDIEIKQYKDEGAVLARKTVATEVFDEDAFAARYAHINEISKSFAVISENIKDQVPLPKANIAVATNQKESSNRVSTLNGQDKIKKSPNKKRKFFESRRQQMLIMAKSKQNETIEFESSQSQTMSQSPPHDELAEINKSLDELNAKRARCLSIELDNRNIV